MKTKEIKILYLGVISFSIKYCYRKMEKALSSNDYDRFHN